MRLLLNNSRDCLHIVCLFRLRYVWYSNTENICITSKAFGELREIFSNLRKSCAIFGRVWVIVDRVSKCSHDISWSSEWFGWSSGVLGKRTITFCCLRMASGEVPSPSKYLGLPPCLRTNFGYLCYNLRLCFQFALMFQICTGVTWRLHFFLANQNGAIFSTVLLKNE